MIPHQHSPLFFLLVVLLSIFSACGEDRTPASKQRVQTYTCSMHPQIIREAPGTCPVCGMDLVAFDKNNPDPSLTLDQRQVELANITTMAVGVMQAAGDTSSKHKTSVRTNGKIPGYKTVNARLVADPGQSTIVSSRVSGRVESLFTREPGIRVDRGQPIYKIYSEELAALQQEYLISTAQTKAFPDNPVFQEIEKAARRKLRLFDLTDEQLKSIVDTQEPSPYVTYYSPVNGHVAEIFVTQGEYVASGSPVVRVESYDSLWIEADLYPTEASTIQTGQRFRVAHPGSDVTTTLTVRYIGPATAPGSQLVQVRGTIPNPHQTWIPGSAVTVQIPWTENEETLVVPANAVIHTGSGSHVWVETAPGHFEPRQVTTGMATDRNIEITAGLEEAEKIVVSGAYLLYSEYHLKKGINPLEAHAH